MLISVFGGEVIIILYTTWYLCLLTYHIINRCCFAIFAELNKVYGNIYIYTYIYTYLGPRLLFKTVTKLGEQLDINVNLRHDPNRYFTLQEWNMKIPFEGSTGV